MIALIARLTVVPGQEEKFENIMTGLANKVRENEAGCSLFKVCRTEIPEQYVILERYDSQNAFDEHQRVAYFKEIIPELKGVLAAGVEIEQLSEI